MPPTSMRPEIAIIHSPWPHVLWWLATALHYGLLLADEWVEPKLGYRTFLGTIVMWPVLPLTWSSIVRVPPLVHLYPAWLLACVVIHAKAVGRTAGDVADSIGGSWWRRWWGWYRAYVDVALGRRWRHVALVVATPYVLMILSWLDCRTVVWWPALTGEPPCDFDRKLCENLMPYLILVLAVPPWLVVIVGLSLWAIWRTAQDRRR